MNYCILTLHNLHTTIPKKKKLNFLPKFWWSPTRRQTFTSHMAISVTKMNTRKFRRKCYYRKITQYYLQTSGNLNFIQIFISYRIVNTLTLGYEKGSLMLYGEIITAFSENNAKHINRQCWEKVDFLNVKFVTHKVTTGF